MEEKENYLYFTLPMALNYQRNSYVLWECANKLYREMPILFQCRTVVSMPEKELWEALVQYKVALQPNKQPEIWRTLCNTFGERFDGDVRNFFWDRELKVAAVKEYIRENKKLFPYLGGKESGRYKDWLIPLWMTWNWSASRLYFCNESFL